MVVKERPRRVSVGKARTCADEARTALMRLYLAVAPTRRARADGHDAWRVARVAIDALRDLASPEGDVERRREFVSAWAAIRGSEDGTIEALDVTHYHRERIRGVSFVRNGQHDEARERRVRMHLAREYVDELCAVKDRSGPKVARFDGLPAPRQISARIIAEIVDVLMRRPHGRGSGLYAALARVVLLCTTGAVDTHALRSRANAYEHAAASHAKGLAQEPE